MSPVGACREDGIRDTFHLGSVDQDTLVDLSTTEHL